MRYLIILLTGFAIFPYPVAQEKTVKGKITTFKEIPVENVSIQVKSSGQVFHSDSTGSFTVLCGNTDKLVASAEGFIKQRVTVGKETRFVLINLTLLPSEEAKELAIGYGHVKDKNKLYAIASKEEGTYNFSRYRDIFELLKGNFPGVQVVNREVIIRGSGTFGSNNAALLIVDGREVSTETFGAILTSDIASINILKDGGSSVYGVKGGNGVVIVETKRGK